MYMATINVCFLEQQGHRRGYSIRVLSEPNLKTDTRGSRGSKQIRISFWE